MTKVTANPMPIEDSCLLETPTNGQMPKKRAKTKLFINAALNNIKRSFAN